MTATLTPPNRAALWSRLDLNRAQLAVLVGITVRQVQHWTSMGYLTPSPRDPSHYSGVAIERATLIKQALDQGVPLRRAVRLVEAYLSAQEEEQPGIGTFEAASLQDIAGRLQGALEQVRLVLEVVDPLVRQKEVDGAAAG